MEEDRPGTEIALVSPKKALCLSVVLVSENKTSVMETMQGRFIRQTPKEVILRGTALLFYFLLDDKSRLLLQKVTLRIK